MSKYSYTFDVFGSDRPLDYGQTFGTVEASSIKEAMCQIGEEVEKAIGEMVMLSLSIGKVDEIPDYNM